MKSSNLKIVFPKITKKNRVTKKSDENSNLDQTECARLNFENELLSAIIDCTSNGIFVIDGNKKIIFNNDNARKIFDIPKDKELINKYFIEIIRNNNINSNIDNCLQEENSFSKEIFYFANVQKHLNISFCPTSLLEPFGCIMHISDITKVRKLEQIRSEFVSNVTHELKTPLTSIRGFIETLRSGAIHDSSVANSFLEIIDIESERLYTLINDILQLSEIETRQKKDDKIAILNVSEVVDEVFEILKPATHNKNIRLINEVEPNIQMSINRYRLKQLLINLVDNGIKYNEENGQVTVSCYVSIGKITFCVEDTGIGIPKEHHSRIFERFYTVDKSRSRKLGGTGLGLSIVKHIVNLYDGNTYFISESCKGTKFFIDFPNTKFNI